MNRYADRDFYSDKNAAIHSALTEIGDLLTEYPTEEAKTVRRIAKVGPKTESFCYEALAQAKVHHELMPRGLDLERVERTLEAREVLREQYERAALLAEKIRTAMTLLGVDVFADGLMIYSSLKLGKTPEVKASVAKLSRCFERKRKKAAQPASAETGVPNATGGQQAKAPRTPVQAEPRSVPAKLAGSADNGVPMLPPESGDGGPGATPNPPGARQIASPSPGAIRQDGMKSCEPAAARGLYHAAEPVSHVRMRDGRRSAGSAGPESA